MKDWNELQKAKVDGLKVQLKKAKRWEYIAYFLMFIFLVEFAFSFSANYDYKIENGKLQSDKEELIEKLKKYEHNEGK